jgi:hypothetical protein
MDIFGVQLKWGKECFRVSAADARDATDLRL